MFDFWALANPFQTLVAILAAATTAWFLNGKILPILGSRGLVFLTPLVEEGTKTIWAVSLQGALIWVHLGFGLLEGLLELKRRGVRGIVAAWSALTSHSILGILTAWFYTQVGLLLAVLLVAALHMGWNMLVVYHKRIRPLTNLK